MEKLLNANFNPEHYLPEVTAKARAHSIDQLDGNLLFIRMIIELRAKNLVSLEKVIARILLDPPSGYEMYQVMTARMIVAYWKDDKAEFLQQTELWLDGRRTWRSNWNSDVLGISEFKPWLSKMNPKLFELEKAALSEITAEDRVFIQDERGFLLAALKENLEHFRAMDIKGSVANLAKKYHVSHVNQHLREITFDADGDLPGLIVAVDENGKFAGSFIAH
jgi:hypothetical protein